MLDDKAQEERAKSYGISNVNAIFKRDDLIKKDVVFACSGVTNGEMLNGVTFCKKSGMWKVETMIFSIFDKDARISKIINYFAC